MSDWTGILRDDIMGQNIRNYLPLFNNTDYTSRFEKIFSGGAPYVLSHKLHEAIIPPELLKNKQRVQHTKVSALPSAENNEYYALFAIEDVSDLSGRISEIEQLRNKAKNELQCRLQKEEELKEQNNLLQGILSSTPIATVVIEDKIISWANKSVCHLFGIEDVSVFLGKDTSVFYASDKDYIHVGKLIKQKGSSTNLIEVDAELKRADGTSFTGHLMMSCVYRSDPFKKLIVTISDLTSRIEAEDSRVNSEKLQGVLEMAGAVCHELNQPLMAISGYTDLLLLKSNTSDSSYDKLSKIKQQVDKTSEITKKLMNITQYKTKQYGENETIFDINQSTSAKAGR